MHWYKCCGPKVLELIFLKIKDIYNIFYSKQAPLPYIRAFTSLCSFWKDAENFFCWTFWNSSFTAPWSQQHPQSGVVLTSFSTWVTQNSVPEINLENTGVIKCCNIFWGQKLANICSFVGGRIIAQQKKISRAERSWTNPLNALQEAIHYSFTKFCIYCFSLWYELFVQYAVRVEKLSTWSWFGTFRISFPSAEGLSRQPIRNRVALFKVIRKTPLRSCLGNMWLDVPFAHLSSGVE